MSTKLETSNLALSRFKRELLLRDALVFVTLTSITLVLYALTYFVFRSFEHRRAGLAVYWFDRGRDDMSHGHPDQAAISFRHALSFDSDNRKYEQLLAQALSESGQTDQAMIYFLNLWDSQPGDGFINLELARLSREKGRVQSAVNYYHASIFGDWQGNGSIQRRNIRFELADYLTSTHDPASARVELLIASGNSLNNVDVNLLLGAKFAAIGDTADALSCYKKVLADNPHEQTALEAVGRLSFQLGDYPAAHSFLDKALEEEVNDPIHREQVLTLSQQARRFEDLAGSPNLAPHVRAEHLLLGRTIAAARLNSCLGQSGLSAQEAALVELKSRWESAGRASLRALEEDEALEESLWTLIGDTENVASDVCGVPSGDDAILLKLATSRETHQ